MQFRGLDNIAVGLGDGAGQSAWAGQQVLVGEADADRQDARPMNDSARQSSVMPARSKIKTIKRVVEARRLDSRVGPWAASGLIELANGA